jgi:hypothetical protein
MPLDMEEILINDLYDRDNPEEKKQRELKDEALKTIKNGYGNIHMELKCCYNCKPFNRTNLKCESKESLFSNNIVSDVLNVCCYYEK